MKRKSISFKTAFIIVVGLHIFGALALVQISSIKAKLARIEWKERLEKRERSTTVDRNDWPNNSVSKVVAAKPPTRLIPSTTNEAIQKNVIRAQQLSSEKPTSSSTPTTVYSSNTEYKNGKIVSRNTTSRRVIEVNYPFTVTSSRINNPIQVISIY